MKGYTTENISEFIEKAKEKNWPDEDIQNEIKEIERYTKMGMVYPEKLVVPYPVY